MIESPKAPGGLGFKTLCAYCEQIVDVRSDGEVFRHTRHPMPLTGPWRGLDCPRSDLRFDP